MATKQSKGGKSMSGRSISPTRNTNSRSGSTPSRSASGSRNAKSR